MTEFVKLIIAFGVLFVIGWFVSFQYDPYRVCKDHSDSSMKRDFYECEPGGFVLEKGTKLERNPEDRFPWEKHGDVIIGTSKPIKRMQPEEKPIKSHLEAIKCKPEFYELSNSQIMNLTKEEIARLCPDAGKVESLRKEHKLDTAPLIIDDYITEEL